LMFFWPELIWCFRVRANLSPGLSHFIKLHEAYTMKHGQGLPCMILDNLISVHGWSRLYNLLYHTDSISVRDETQIFCNFPQKKNHYSYVLSFPCCAVVNLDFLPGYISFSPCSPFCHSVEPPPHHQFMVPISVASKFTSEFLGIDKVLAED
jgi:hypothetical protein